MDSDFLTTAEAARLLNVSEGEIRFRVEAGEIPSLESPTGEYRIPQRFLLASRPDSYDLAAELQCSISDMRSCPRTRFEPRSLTDS